MSDPSPDPFLSLSEALAGHVAAVSPSIVGLRSRHTAASGFFWKSGLVVSADEALAEDETIEAVLPGGEHKTAAFVGRDPTTNVALLRVEGATAPAIALERRDVRPGSLALVVGARAGAPLAALGTVAFAGPAWRSMRGGAIDARVELGTRLPRDAEGGLVLDAAGRAAGMAVFGPRRRVLVIPAATIDRVAAQLERHGRIPRGYLGLALQRVRVDRDHVGAMAMSVDAEGPAAKAGFCQGDVVVGLGGEPLKGIRPLIDALGPDSIGKTLRLGVRRAGAPLELELTVGERPHA